jgi:hypothetical protein
MMPKTSLVAMFVVAIVVGTNTSACGLVSSDITTIKFNLPAKTYSFDTASWMLPSGSLPAAPCTTSAECCAAAALVGYNCATQAPLSCTSGSCSLSKTVESMPQSVNLMAESGLSNQSVADISISQITYDVNSTLNVELPQVDLFLAPSGVTSTTDPMAKRFAWVVPTAAGAMFTGHVAMIDPAGNAAFTQYAHSLGTPFNFLSATTVTVAGGSPFPMGKVDITVKGQLAAKPSL